MRAEGDIDQYVRQTCFPEGEVGVLVEVGAARPDFLSIGQSFRHLGWRVISIEPNPEFCAAHRAMGNDVLQYACGDHDADGVPFTVIDSYGANYMGGTVSYESFSSLGLRGDFADLYAKGEYKKSKRTISVNVRRLDTILAQHAPDLQKIDLLAVDVEGWEVEVMKGLAVERFKPRAVILENLFTDPAYAAYMQGVGYRLAKMIAPNEVYVLA